MDSRTNYFNNNNNSEKFFFNASKKNLGGLLDVVQNELKIKGISSRVFNSLDTILLAKTSRNQMKDSNPLRHQFASLYAEAMDLFVQSRVEHSRNLFISIPSSEFLSLTSTDMSLKPNYNAMLEDWNITCTYVRLDIIEKKSLKESLLALEWWILIAKKCIEQHDLNSAHAIFVALNSSAILQLRGTDDENLSPSAQKNLADIEDIMSLANNSRKLREIMSVNDQCIPVLSIYAKDLVFTNENPTRHFNCLFMLSESSPIPLHIDQTTLVLQKKEGKVTAYWNENSNIRRNALEEKEIADLVQELPKVGEISNDVTLLKKISSTFGCSFKEELINQKIIDPIKKKQATNEKLRKIADSKNQLWEVDNFTIYNKLQKLNSSKDQSLFWKGVVQNGAPDMSFLSDRLDDVAYNRAKKLLGTDSDSIKECTKEVDESMSIINTPKSKSSISKMVKSISEPSLPIRQHPTDNKKKTSGIKIIEIKTSTIKKEPVVTKRPSMNPLMSQSDSSFFAKKQTQIPPLPPLERTDSHKIIIPLKRT